MRTRSARIKETEGRTVVLTAGARGDVRGDVRGRTPADRRARGRAVVTTLRPLWGGLALILAYNGLLAAWLTLRPAPLAVIQAVDNVAQGAGPLLALPLCWGGLAGPWRRGREGAAGAVAASRWMPVLLGLGVLGFAVGQAIWTYYQEIIHQPPFPSWADAGYLAAYPCLGAGLLLLPRRPLPSAARLRVLLDGVMLMTGVVAFSWYFVLGPTVLQGSESLIGKLVGAAYPFGDLVLVCSLLLLWGRSQEREMRPVVALFSAGLGCILTVDTAFAYGNLHETYATGGLVDVGWPLGYMLLALATRAARQVLAPAGHTEHAPPALAADAPAPLWRALLPYAFLPAVGALALSTGRLRGATLLEQGVWIGAGALGAVVVLRQVVALLETRQLYRQVEERNQALAAVNGRLEALATTDALTGLPNHRAMVTALDLELERAHRFGRPCTLLFLDLDHFKALNDGYGHAAGDAVLRELAAVARRALRGVDTLGRWGGEEFVALLPEADGSGALEVAERVRVAVAAHPFPIGGGAHLTCSLGVATYPAHAGGRDGLVDAADQAMYAAKRLGRNQARAADDPAAVLLAGSEAGGSREEAALAGTVEALAALVDARDAYTGGHAHDVAALARRLALALGLDAAEARMVGLAARLHDVGKVAVPDAILRKPGRLTEEEWAVMRTHPAVGADVVGRAPALRALAPAIRAHHERWDGRGYPDGVAGERIPLAARLIAVVDAYEVMTTGRPYRAARSRAGALDELRRHAGGQFDPAVVAALADLLAADHDCGASASA